MSVKEAKTAAELFPNLIQAKKVRTFIEYDADIIAAFRAASTNWEERINYALREWLSEHAL
jgi:uncharacterized protein (DUF4415 family)